MLRLIALSALSLMAILFPPCARAQENGGEGVPEAVQAVLDRVYTLDDCAVKKWSADIRFVYENRGEKKTTTTTCRATRTPDAGLSCSDVVTDDEGIQGLLDGGHSSFGFCDNLPFFPARRLLINFYDLALYEAEEVEEGEGTRIDVRLRDADAWKGEDFAGPSAATFHLDADGWLHKKRELHRSKFSDPPGEETWSENLYEWKDADDFWLPTKVIQRDSVGDAIFTFEYEEQDGVQVLVGVVESYGEIVERIEISNVELEFDE